MKAATKAAKPAPKAAGPIDEDRLLNRNEKSMVSQSYAPAIGALGRAELESLRDRLRAARARARDIGHQQKREMRGKAGPRGAAPAAENAGTLEKAELLAGALRRVGVQLRKLAAPSATEVLRSALAKKKAAAGANKPDPGRTAAKGMTAKASTRRTVRSDPREIGRVSQAVKVAQAKRDK